MTGSYNEKRMLAMLQDFYDDTTVAGHVIYFSDGECKVLAEYFEKQGVVAPPVEVGQKVWYIEGGYYSKVNLKPREIEVTEINKKKSGKTIEWAFIANGTRYKFTSIGKSVFLNKEDCEAAIAKRKK